MAISSGTGGYTPPGLVLVKTQTIGTTVATVAVTDCFSASYNNYRIIATGGTQSGNEASYIQLGASATGYYGVLIYADATGATVSMGGLNNANQMSWVGGGATGQAHHTSVDIFSPFASSYTKFRNGQYQNATNYGTLNGEHRVATSYTGFTLGFTGGQTFTGGTIYVYGYR
jgi:hypothetical protein